MWLTTVNNNIGFFTRIIHSMRKSLLAIDLKRLSATVPHMGESKKDKVDRHLSGFMVRLPIEYREAINKIRTNSRRTITEEIKIALEEYFRNHGMADQPKPPQT